MSSSAPHIFTLTGNLLAERTFEFASWQAGKTQRATRESFQVGGKGINVSKMLNRLGAPNTALCFTGGAPGAECEAWLRERNFSHRAFPTGQPTRTGLVVRGGVQPETTFLGSDVPPGAEALGGKTTARQIAPISFPWSANKLVSPVANTLAAEGDGPNNSRRRSTVPPSISTQVNSGAATQRWHSRKSSHVCSAPTMFR